VARTGIIILVVVVAIVAGGAVYLLKGNGGKTDVRVTVDSIKNIAELATVEYHISSYLFRAKKKAWYEWKHAKYLVFVKGTVKGSVDLDQAAIDVNPDPKKKMVKITFRKGAVRVSNPEIGKGDVTFQSVSDPNVFHPITEKDYERSQNELIGIIREQAIKEGIRNKTAAQARLVLTTFLQSLGYTAQIEFEESFK
jgi:hypothetical protein